MKIEIQNLGPIHHFEFDLEKDLHLLYGENNVGKSFAVNVMYCLVKVLLKERKGHGEVILGEEMEDYLNLAERIIRHSLEKEIISDFHDALKNTYDILTPIIPKSKKQSVLIIDTHDFHTRLVLNNSGRFDIDSFQLSNSLKKTLDIAKNSSERQLSGEMFSLHNVSNYLFSNIFLLPASRSGLYPPLSGMGEILAQLSLLRNSLKANIELPALSESVSDYFLNLVSINGKASLNELIKLAENIENTVLKGKINFNQQTKKIYFNPNGANENISISQTASMVSELAPFVLYLKHLFPERFVPYLLIIEEPEAHLHPKVQVQLMEIFAELTKHNVKVILTSHSNYMFNKLSNMLLKKEIAPEKVGVYHMIMTENGSVVAPDMQATTQGIEDHNFADVAKELYQERLETYDLLNEDPDAAK